MEGEGIKQIDFLGDVIGLKREGVMRRAVTLHLSDGTRLQLLHPLDVLESQPATFSDSTCDSALAMRR